MLYIIQTTSPVKGFWSGSKWQRSKATAFVYNSFEQAHTQRVEKFSWLRPDLYNAITVVEK